MTSLTPDSEYRGLMGLIPQAARPFALLARFDRPIGWWLLFWPCSWGVLLSGGLAMHWPLLGWFLIGSIAMRGAGCVYNDMADRTLDAQVERTRNRPLASGAVSMKAAWVWLVMLALAGLVVLFQLNIKAQLVALGSVGLVAAYPFMKRITWWPQVWLGFVFSWGALVGWIAVAEHAHPAMAFLYAGSIAWVIGYDTIYAIQDIEDDAIVGVRSTARRFGDQVRLGVALFYAAAILFWGLAIWSIRPQPLAVLALLPVTLHLIWQAATLKPNDGDNALAKFRSNRQAGFLMALATLVVGSA